MAIVKDYRTCVQQLLEQYYSPSLPTDGVSTATEVECQLIIDTNHDHYQLVHVGWENGHRIYSCVLHLDIKDDKIWVQQNMTDQLVAEDLVALGVLPEHIVLGFQPPYARQFTGFGMQ